VKKDPAWELPKTKKPKKEKKKKSNLVKKDGKSKNGHPQVVENNSRIETAPPTLTEEKQEREVEKRTRVPPQTSLKLRKS